MSNYSIILLTAIVIYTCLVCCLAIVVLLGWNVGVAGAFGAPSINYIQAVALSFLMVIVVNLLK